MLIAKLVEMLDVPMVRPVDRVLKVPAPRPPTKPR